MSSLVVSLWLWESYTGVISIPLKKADITPAEQLQAYAEAGSYMAQKYFGKHRKFKKEDATRILGLDAEGKPVYGVPLSNFMNAQVRKEKEKKKALSRGLRLDGSTHFTLFATLACIIWRGETLWLNWTVFQNARVPAKKAARCIRS